MHEFVGLPEPVMQNDYIAVKEFHYQGEDMNKTAGGIYMPGLEDPTGNVRSTDLYIVVGVGAGPWIDSTDIDGKPQRRPMPCKVGDVIAKQGKVFDIHVPGAIVGILQAYQVICVLGRLEQVAAKAEPKVEVILQ